jgi:hypothetical protein
VEVFTTDALPHGFRYPAVQSAIHLIGATTLPQQKKRNEMTYATSVAAQGDLLPMSFDKMGFLIDKLFDDCAPLQFVRELTKNSVESIARLPNSTGEIRWDVDWKRFDLTNEQEMKLCAPETA